MPGSILPATAAAGESRRVVLRSDFEPDRVVLDPGRFPAHHPSPASDVRSRSRRQSIDTTPWVIEV